MGVRAHGGVMMVCQYVSVSVRDGVCDHGKCVSVCVCERQRGRVCISVGDGAHVRGMWV